MAFRRLTAGALLATALAACGGGDEEAATTQQRTEAEAAGGAATGETSPPPQRVTVEGDVVLRIGDVGPHVRRLQKALAALDLDLGRPDGVFGVSTRNAVVVFQRRNDLDADGVVGPRTARAINRALAARG
jgi:peptidoglycan hydrolase-like protein with peptidoglycan-binding domain